MRLSLGFSPCPNDTFIFDALVNGKIDTGDFQFEPVLEDVQTLNRWAMKKKLSVSKISYGVWPLIRKDYRLLDAGGALGRGVGPLLIAKKEIPLPQVDQLTIAIPGEQTTANVLFSLAFPKAALKKFMLFSDIESAVLNGTVDCGVIIHENRFTYMQRGLVKLMDLGEFWEQKTQSPIPLGGIVIRRDIDPQIAERVDALIRKSVSYAQSNYPVLADYVKQHSQEMEESVMRQHIDLYVNDYSLGLGEEGRKAVDVLLEVCNAFL
ncbi:MAG: 1,4-dihydroxy-6-naphthoate synthase [Bacteroidota bacterium]|nr:1,4-dihydroxy-6-naphthoate synthase [Bacteroidota bacterium]MDP4250062.1 1,4-dihydroxy-6-naphthoate synthase [Bacteroidota bacterium]